MLERIKVFKNPKYLSYMPINWNRRYSKAVILIELLNLVRNYNLHWFTIETNKSLGKIF